MKCKENNNNNNNKKKQNKTEPADFMAFWTKLYAN